jgi:hypothetical protein
MGESQIPSEIANVIKSLPVWYSQRVVQLSYIANNFSLGQISANGIVVSCLANDKSLRQLIERYK